MGSTKCGFIITILMLLKTSEAGAQNSLVPKGQISIHDTSLNTRFLKKSKGCKSGKRKKEGKKGRHDSVVSGGAYWESFAPSMTPGALDFFVQSASPACTFNLGDEYSSGPVANPPSSAPTSAPLPVYPPNAVIEDSPRPWSTPDSAVDVPTESVDTSQPAPTYAHGNEDSGQSRPTPGSPVEPPTATPVTSTNPGTPGAGELSPTEADILTEQAGSGDYTGLLSACANNPPETSANTEIRVLAFEYAMLVVPETTYLYIESIVREVEDRLHEVLAKELLQCVFSADTRVQRLGGEQDEFDFLSISSLPKDFLTSDDCADDEKRDNTDCLVIAGIFTVEFLKGGSLDDLFSGLTRLMKEFMPPKVRRELAENLSVADIDPNLKGLVFRSFIAPFDDTAGVDPIVDGSEQPDDDGSSNSRRAVAGAAIVGTAAALAIVVGYLTTQRRRRRRSLDLDGETTTNGIQPRPSDSFSTHSSVLPILYDPQDNEMYDMSELYTMTGLEPFECGGSENGNNDCEKTHNSIPCEVTSKMYDMSELCTTTELEPSECGGSENGHKDCEKTHNSISCELTSEMYDICELYTTTGLEASQCGGSENDNNDCEKTHNSIPCELTSCRKVLFPQNSIEMDREVI